MAVNSDATAAAGPVVIDYTGSGLDPKASSNGNAYVKNDVQQTPVNNPANPVNKGTPYVAPTLYGPNGQVAASTSTTTQAQVNSAITSGWTTTAPQNSPANVPSSSATVPLAIKGNNATEVATSGTLPTSQNAASSSAIANMLQQYGITSPTASSDIQALMDSGLSITDAVNAITQLSGIGDAKKAAADQQTQRQVNYDANLASENAQYSAAWSKLNQDRANAKDTATAQLASLNSSGGIGSDSSQFLAHVDATYDLAANQLTLQAQQAKAALDAGDAQTYATIQQNMANTISQTKANIQNLLSSVQANKTTQSNFDKTEQDKAATQYRSTLTTLPLAQATDYSALPSDVGALTPEQLKSIQGTTAYQQGHSAGLTDQAILTDLRTLSTTPSFKQQQITNTANMATARLAISQANLADKQSAQIDLNNINNTPGGTAFSTAFGQVNSEHSKDENGNFLSSLSSFLQVGNKKAAANATTNYILNTKSNSSFGGAIDSLRVVAGIVGPIMQKIAALPADQQAGLLKGSYQDVAARLGQNPNPELQRLGSELSHVGVIYARAVGGVRAAAATSQGGTIFGSLIPNIKDSKSLMMSDLSGFVNTSNDLLNSAIKTKIGSEAFDQIYGSQGGALGVGKASTQTAPTKGATQSYQGGTYTFDGTNWVLRK